MSFKVIKKMCNTGTGLLWHLCIELHVFISILWTMYRASVVSHYIELHMFLRILWTFYRASVASLAA